MNYTATKKYLSALVLFVMAAMSVTLTGCGKDDDNDDPFKESTVAKMLVGTWQESEEGTYLAFDGRYFTITAGIETIKGTYFTHDRADGKTGLTLNPTHFYNSEDGADGLITQWIIEDVTTKHLIIYPVGYSNAFSYFSRVK